MSRKAFLPMGLRSGRSNLHRSWASVSVVLRSTPEGALTALADRVFVAHAAPGSGTEAFCRKVLEWKKPLLTLDAPENAALMVAGAQSVVPGAPGNKVGP